MVDLGEFLTCPLVTGVIEQTWSQRFDANACAYLYAGVLAANKSAFLRRAKGCSGRSPPPAQVETDGSGGLLERLACVGLMPCDDGNTLTVLYDHAGKQEMVILDRNLHVAAVETNSAPSGSGFAGPGFTCWLDNERSATGERRFAKVQLQVDFDEGHVTMDIGRYRSAQPPDLVPSVVWEKQVAFSFALPRCVAEQLNLPFASQCRRGCRPGEVLFSFTCNWFPRHAATVSVQLSEDFDPAATPLQPVIRVLALDNYQQSPFNPTEATSSASCELSLRASQLITFTFQRLTADSPTLYFYRAEDEYDPDRPARPVAQWTFPLSSFTGAGDRLKRAVWRGLLQPHALLEVLFDEVRIGVASWAKGLALVRWRVVERIHRIQHDYEALSYRNYRDESRTWRQGDARLIVYRFPWISQLHPLLPHWFRTTVRAILLLSVQGSSVIRRPPPPPRAVIELEVIGGEAASWGALPYEVIELVITTLFEEYLRWNKVPTRAELLATEEPIVLWADGAE